MLRVAMSNKACDSAGGGPLVGIFESVDWFDSSLTVWIQ